MTGPGSFEERKSDELEQLRGFLSLSGLSLIAVAFVSGMKAKDRGWCAVGGLALLIYGFYVANQTTGTWTFPAVIFVLPFGVVGYILYTFGKRKGYFGGSSDQNRS